jgi:hypothetical protein
MLHLIIFCQRYMRCEEFHKEVHICKTDLVCTGTDKSLCLLIESCIIASSHYSILYHNAEITTCSENLNVNLTCLVLHQLAVHGPIYERVT